MYNPTDFIPAKYKKNTDKVEGLNDDLKNLKEANSQDIKTDSPWSDLAKEPKTPEYRSDVILDENGIKNELSALSKIDELKAISQAQAVPVIPKNKTGNKKKLTGLLVVFFLVIGVFSSYMLAKQNQDVRQQASVGSVCNTDPSDPYYDPNCVCSYNGLSSMTCRIDPDAKNEACGDGYHSVNGYCIPSNCQDRDGNGNYVCGYPTDEDPCTTDSMGGDWCTDAITGQSISCASLGMIRCQCSPGSGGGYWVIGIADTCYELCGEAEIDCSDCDAPPGPPSTPTPTSPPRTLTCGEFGCNTNSDCGSGLTCQIVSNNNQSRGICALGQNQLFCAASPTVENCCEDQAMPVCASIEMLDASNNLMEGDDDKSLKVGDKVRFRCSASGNQGVSFNYQFRIWDKSTSSWANITDTSNTVAKNISALYTIGNFGKHIVQGRICWENECQPWEIVSGAPTTSEACYGENAVACPSGQVCSAVPAGGCPTITVNGITTTTTCASVPVCRQAEGISCQTTSDCFSGYICNASKYCTKQ